jgi:L-lactate dehydrogenase complex protein LldG
MGDDRQRVMARVRAATARLERRAPMPTYPDDVARTRSTSDPAGALVDRFRERLLAAGGRVFTDAHALAQWLADRRCFHGYCDPALVAALEEAFVPPLSIETRFARERIDDYTFSVTEAAGAIAETGSLVLIDRPRSRRLAAIAPWVHVAVVPRSRIHREVADAIVALGDEPYVLWCTGPSKTADVEGILIQGVHGPGEQVALIVEG